MDFELKAPGRVHGIGGHHRTHGTTNTWLTPPALLRELGSFDLDPCAAEEQPWKTADVQYTHAGLQRDWHGRVWLNPPYGPHVGAWLDRLVVHGNGIALVFARSETDWFHRCLWDHAHAIFFFRGRLKFHRQDGSLPPSTCGAPSVLAAFGWHNVRALTQVSNAGRLVVLR